MLNISGQSFGSLTHDGTNPQRTSNPTRSGLLLPGGGVSPPIMVRIGCVGAILYRGGKSSAINAAAKASSSSRLAVNEKRPHMASGLIPTFASYCYQCRANVGL